MLVLILYIPILDLEGMFVIGHEFTTGQGTFRLGQEMAKKGERVE